MQRVVAYHALPPILHQQRTAQSLEQPTLLDARVGALRDADANAAVFEDVRVAD